MSKKQSEREKEKGVWFTAVSHKDDIRDIMKKNCTEFPFYAWIDHVPDKETEESDKHFHTHVVVSTRGSRSVKQVSDVLGVPSQYVQRVKQKRGMLRYLIHLDNPEKLQYNETDVHTNRISTLKTSWTDNSDDDVRRLYRDLQKLQSGLIPPDEFLERHFLEFQKMPFYQKIKTYEIMQKLYAQRLT